MQYFRSASNKACMFSSGTSPPYILPMTVSPPSGRYNAFTDSRTCLSISSGVANGNICRSKSKLIVIGLNKAFYIQYATKHIGWNLQNINARRRLNESSAGVILYTVIIFLVTAIRAIRMHIADILQRLMNNAPIFAVRACNMMNIRAFDKFPFPFRPIAHFNP